MISSTFSMVRTTMWPKEFSSADTEVKKNTNNGIFMNVLDFKYNANQQ